MSFKEYWRRWTNIARERKNSKIEKAKVEQATKEQKEQLPEQSRKQA